MCIFRDVFIILSLALGLSACQSTLQHTYFDNEQLPPIYIDNEFSGFEDVLVETDEQIFAIEDNIKNVVKNKLAPIRDTREKATALLRHIFSKDKDSFSYQSGANVIASEAYRSKEANCLSLTIMAYTLANESGLNVEFQSVKVPEYWVRNGHLNMLTGHVNLRVVDHQRSGFEMLLEREMIEIDFDPFVAKKIFPKKTIEKNTVIAMFYNNKGANAMVKGDFITAYAYLKSATLVDPDFSAAWGNLSILYRFKGFNTHAVNGYRYAISIDSNNLTAVSNLSLILHKQGEIEEAEKLDLLLIKHRANNPYYYALLGDERYFQGNYNEAISHYRKAIKLDANSHEFYFGLAKVFYKLNQYNKAKRYIKKAIAKNKRPSTENQYLAKLHMLNKINKVAY